MASITAQSCSYCLLGIRLVCLRPTEIGQHAVTHIAGNEPLNRAIVVERRPDSRGRRTQVLRIEARR